MLRALCIRVRVRDAHEMEAWLRSGSNQVSPGHVELSNSGMYDMEEEEEHEVDVLFFFFFINPIYRAKRVSKLHVREDALVYI